MALNLRLARACEARNSTKVELRASDIPQNLRFQCVGRLELSLLADAPQEFDSDALRRVSVERCKQVGFDRQTVAVESRTEPDIRDGSPLAPRLIAIMRACDVHAPGREHLGLR